MFKKLLYFFRKTSNHTTSANTNQSIQINTDDLENLDNSVEKIIEEVEQTFTDWQHTGLNSVHPTEIEQCEELIKKLKALEEDSANGEQLQAKLDSIKAIMQSGTESSIVSNNIPEPTNIEEQAPAESNSYIKENEVEQRVNTTDEPTIDVYPDNPTIVEKNENTEEHEDAISETTILANTDESIESNASNTEADTTGRPNQLVEAEVPDQSTNAVLNAVDEKNSSSTEKPVNNNDNEEQAFIYLPKLSINTPLVCLEQEQLAKDSSVYNKLSKRTKNLLDKHGEWAKLSENIVYHTDIIVDDDQAYLHFLKSLLATTESKKLTPEQKITVLNKLEEQENLQPFLTTHFGADKDWKIFKSIEVEVKNIKGINTKQAVSLFKQGYTTKEAICSAPDDILLALPRVGKATLEKIRKSNI